jgi:hypothetical protein
MNISSGPYGNSELAMHEPHKTAQRRAYIAQLGVQGMCPGARVRHAWPCDPFYSYRVATNRCQFGVRFDCPEIAEIGLSEEKFVARFVRKVARILRELSRAAHPPSQL